MYEDFYGLKGKPFQLSPDARFFFDSRGHNRAMAYLRYGLRQGEGFIVITGGIGTGKTMLVRNLFAELDQDHFVAAQLVSTQVDAEDILRIISSSFGLPSEDIPKSALLENLEAFLRARKAEGKRALVIVDEAQNLPPQTIEELRMLSNFQDGGQALMQSFLLGQIELMHTLQGPHMEQVRQRIIAGCHLRPLDREETEAYIEHRLKLVDWHEDPSISPKAMDAIFTASDGVPRRINTLADRLLLFGCLEEIHSLDTDHVDTVVSEIAQEIGAHISRDEGLKDPMDVMPTADDSIEDRLLKMEKEIERLRLAQRKDRKLLKRAILMQMEMDDADDDDI